MVEKDFNRIEHEGDIIIPLLPPQANNLKKKKTVLDVFKSIQPNLKLEFILDDFVLPPKSIMIGEVLKKNNKLGYVKRFLMLGHS